MSNKRETIFLVLTLVLSLPFYVWGVISPVSGLPFDLPISFLMIFVPFFISLTYAWQEHHVKGIRAIFAGVIDARKAKPITVLIGLFCMPVVLFATYFSMKFASLPLPEKYALPYAHIPIMFALYFLGAIPEEFGWTYTLTGSMAEKFGKIGAGIIIGSVWAIWHVIPWSWAYSWSLIIGMCVASILMRIVMVYLFVNGGKSLFVAILFHAMINASFGLFPINGSYVNTWIVSFWMVIAVAVVVWMVSNKSAKVFTSII